MPRNGEPGAAPSAGAGKYTNSAAISFQGGNKWRDLGKWTSAATVAAAPDVAAAVHRAGDDARTLLFGDTPVRFPLGVSTVECYADAK